MNLEVVRSHQELTEVKLASLPTPVAELWRFIIGKDASGIAGIVWSGNRQQITEGEPLLMFIDGSTALFSKVDQPVQSL